MQAHMFVAGLAALLLAGCSGGGDAAKAPDSADSAAPQSQFKAEIAPLLVASCATCHLTGDEAGGMSLVPDKAIANLVNVPAREAPKLVRVVPGDPDASYLVMKIEGTHLAHGGTGARMPFGAPPLPPEAIAKIRQWIADGAKA